MSSSQQPLNFTLAAATRVFELMQEEGNPALMLRVYVTGGGCSGFQYGFAFEETLQEGDVEVTRDVGEVGAALKEDEEGKDDSGQKGGKVSLLIDPISFQYLVGAEIDYREDLDGAQFVIRNPNAATTCGCGSSFSV